MNDKSKDPRNKDQKGKPVGKRNGYKYRKRGQDKRASQRDETKVETKFNDPEWYIGNGVLAKNVASFSFNNALGAIDRIHFDPAGGNSSLNDYVNVIPGIMNIYTSPAIGVSTAPNDAVNIAAKNIYTWVRHQNSGHANYDSPDLMMYLLAMDSVYSIIAYMMRLYGTARVFSQTNRYVGEALVRGQGLDYGDLITGLSEFRAFINMYITKASAFCTPNTMSLYKRHFWMYSGIYKDEPFTKSQFYQYVPATLWQYNDETGTLWPVTIATAFGVDGFERFELTVYALEQKALDILNALQASEDINIMSGDILKAFGRENLWTLGLMPEEYAVLPVYSEEVLDQIHNTTFAGAYPTDDGLDLDQVSLSLDRLGVNQDKSIGAGNIIFNPQFIRANQLSYDNIVDIADEDPSPERVLVATRNMIAARSAVGTLTGTSTTVPVNMLTTCGSDIALFATTGKMSYATQADPVTWVPNFRAQNNGPDYMMTVFNKRPIRYIFANAGVTTSMTNVSGEIDNYIVVDGNDLKEMHDCAILSMFGVPFYGVSGK